MPRAAAAARAVSSEREARAVTSPSVARCMAGMTLVRAILAAPRTPHRIFFMLASPIPARRYHPRRRSTPMIVRSEFRDLETPTGPMRTYVYTPVHPTVARKYPGLLLYSEIFQQTAPIARLCVQLASHGYVDAGKDKGNRYKHATKLSTFDADAKVVVAALRAHPACSGRIGTVGFCIGGHLAVRAALLPDILACASFFPTDLHTNALGEGKKADTLARIRETKAELVMIWGRQ